MYTYWVSVGKLLVRGGGGEAAVNASIDVLFPLAYLVDPNTSYLCHLTQECLGIRAGRYIYMHSLQLLAHPPSPQPPHPISWPLCTTPIHTALLAHYLQRHPDQDFVVFILQGLVRGFHVGYCSQGRGLRSSSRNHPSSLANTQVIRDYIQEEVSAGRMVGPLASQAISGVHCSPIGLVPKGRNTGQWRMIVDLSCPDGRSVNDGIPSPLCSLTYSSVDEALMFIKALGRGTLLIKVDLKSAYRIVPIHPQDRHLFAIRWEDQVYVDQALPFGLRSAPKLFTAVADAIGWALMQAGILFHIHYLDDFLFFISPSSGHELSALPHILNIF